MMTALRHSLLVVAAASLVLGGCAGARPAPVTAGSGESAARAMAAVDRPAPARLRGLASYYGRPFHGRRTASGERFDMHAYTAAHRTLPFGTRVRVRAPDTGREVVVRINDRGPARREREIDLSLAAARALDLVRAGVAPVELEVLDGGAD